jgi:predicted transcriptional regulator
MSLAKLLGCDKLDTMETVTNPTTALNQLLEPLSRTLGVEAARSIASLQIEPEIQARIEELADLCNEGLLSEAERAEYSGYVEGAEILALIKSKARRYLASHAAN